MILIDSGNALVAVIDWIARKERHLEKRLEKTEGLERSDVQISSGVLYF